VKLWKESSASREQGREEEEEELDANAPRRARTLAAPLFSSPHLNLNILRSTLTPQNLINPPPLL
jgi:hypothetical protein